MSGVMVVLDSTITASYPRLAKSFGSTNPSPADCDGLIAEQIVVVFWTSLSELNSRMLNDDERSVMNGTEEEEGGIIAQAPT